jgi:hypothetical protein
VRARIVATVAVIAGTISLASGVAGPIYSALGG